MHSPLSPGMSWLHWHVTKPVMIGLLGFARQRHGFCCRVQRVRSGLFAEQRPFQNVIQLSPSLTGHDLAHHAARAALISVISLVRWQHLSFLDSSHSQTSSLLMQISRPHLQKGVPDGAVRKRKTKCSPFIPNMDSAILSSSSPKATVPNTIRTCQK